MQYYSYFYIGKSNNVYSFPVKPLNIRENRVNLSISVIFRIKDIKKYHARETNYRLNLEFCNADKKTKNVLRHIFIWIAMPTNFIRFCEEKWAKNCLRMFCIYRRIFRNSLRIFNSAAATNCIFIMTEEYQNLRLPFF